MQPLDRLGVLGLGTPQQVLGHPTRWVARRRERPTEVAVHGLAQPAGKVAVQRIPDQLMTEGQPLRLLGQRPRRQRLAQCGCQVGG